MCMTPKFRQVVQSMPQQVMEQAPTEDVAAPVDVGQGVTDQARMRKRSGLAGLRMTAKTSASGVNIPGA